MIVLRSLDFCVNNWIKENENFSIEMDFDEALPKAV